MSTTVNVHGPLEVQLWIHRKDDGSIYFTNLSFKHEDGTDVSVFFQGLNGAQVKELLSQIKEEEV